jgi:hypothetical protein
VVSWRSICMTTSKSPRRVRRVAYNAACQAFPERRQRFSPKKFLALASWCATRGRMRKMGRVFPEEFRSGVVTFSARLIKRHAR